MIVVKTRPCDPAPRHFLDVDWRVDVVDVDALREGDEAMIGEDVCAIPLSLVKLLTDDIRDFLDADYIASSA